MAPLVAALILLAVPAVAAAATYEVNGNGDGANKAECESLNGADECTLRGAIEAADANPDASQIEFPEALYQGRVGIDEIGPGASPLPSITQPVTIFGPSCEPSPGEQAPCVEVKGRIGEPVLKVESEDVTIERVAFGAAKIGIQVATPAADRFTAGGSWFGLRLDASTDPIETAAIQIGTGADEATIGGPDPSERNVFAHADVGVELKGASKAKVLGNYIGVAPSGSGETEVEVGVRIEDFAGPAEDNEIGAALGATEIAAEECVGPCNAIATKEGVAIQLAGSSADPQQAAHGPTFIRGNFLGLEPDGAGTVGDSIYGVLAAPSEPGCVNGPSDVTVGGSTPGEGNFIVGGRIGIEAESAENFKAIGNAFGITPGGTATTSPGGIGIHLCAEGVTEPALVAGNRMVLEPDTVGIESNFGGATILGNSIRGGLYGILTRDAGIGGGNIIQANTISGTDRQGMLITDDLNVVTANTITGAEWAGITIREGAEGNRIGGDVIGEPNTINSNGIGEPGGAIQIEGEETSRNEVAANTGSGNGGPFIELIGASSKEIPNGLKPPTLTTVYQSSAGGTAAPNTTVRIFSKASADPGELGGLLAVAKADASGAWSATYATRPVGTLVAATQTSDAGTAIAGTSEVSAPTAAAVDPPKPPETEMKTGGGATAQAPATGPPPPAPPQAPKVKITNGPKKNGTATTAKFKFEAEPAAGAKFECKLDGAKWAKCGSPKTYKNLKVGKHTFRVRATASNLTGALTKFQFTVRETG